MKATSVPEVLCLGESMVLVAVAGGQDLETATSAEIRVAGAESNVAQYLADLGHSVSWISRLGDDPLGTRVMNALTWSGVGVGFVQIDPDRPTGVFFKSPAEAATSVYYYRDGSAASGLVPEDLEHVPFDGVEVVHVTGVTLALSENCAATAREFFARAERAGAVRSFDVNYRAGLWSVEDAAAPLRDIARQADVVFVGLDEATTLWGAETPEDVSRLLSGVPIVVVKDSDVGATMFENGKAQFVAAKKVDVLEPVGAGDAFAAGYLSALLRGGSGPERLELGHRVAAFALRSIGDHSDASELRPASPRATAR